MSTRSKNGRQFCLVSTALTLRRRGDTYLTVTWALQCLTSLNHRLSSGWEQISSRDVQSSSARRSNLSV